MSLHISNLSSRTRKDELERVFQRFGRCIVQLKDGFGFVKYWLHSNAEKALRALRNKYICGEPLSLTWSHHSSRPSKRFAKPSRFYESLHGGDSVRGGYIKQKWRSNNYVNYKIRNKQPESDGRRLTAAGLHGDETAHGGDDVKDYKKVEKQHGYEEDFLDEDVRIEPEPVCNDRWNEKYCEQTNENGLETVLEFDRYEPYEGYNGTNDNASCHMANSGGSPLPKSEEGMQKRLTDELILNRNAEKPQTTCYKCGKPGHKWRNCPQEAASRRNLSMFDHRHDDGINRRVGGKNELDGLKSRTWEKRHSSSDMKLPGSGKHQKSVRSRRSSVANDTYSSGENDCGRKKRSRKELVLVSPKRLSTKKARSASSPLHVDYTKSRFHSISPSSKHVKQPESQSRSRSVSGRSRSLSSNSRSCSKSQYSRSKRSKSRSRSRPNPPESLSLSVTSGRSLPFSSKKGHFDVKGISDDASTPQFKTTLIEQVQPGQSDHRLEDDKVENEKAAMIGENAVSSSKEESEMGRIQPLQKGNDNSELVPELLCEARNPSTPLSEKVTLALSDRSFPEERLLGMQDFQNSDASMMECVPIPIKKPDSEKPASSCSGNSTSISTQEICMVLKHYGLEHLNENEKHLPAEAYFGSARLWPWEIIYYRRLKKGLISIENYAKRVDQNKEFGIVDKYIRSSSGWGEFGQENH